MRDLKYFRKHVTSTGLTVFFQRRNIPWFTIGVVIGVGERHDPPDKIGLAHLLEHMLHTGTAGYPRRNLVQLENWLASNGATFDFGSTDLDCMYFYGCAAVNRLRFLTRFLHALVRLPRFRERDLVKQLSLIRAERINEGTDGTHDTERQMRKAAFGDHRLALAGAWPTDRELRRLNLDDVRAMHRRFFTLPNMAVVAIGGIDENRLLSTLEKFFIPDRDEADILPRPLPVEFGPLTSREVRHKVEEAYTATSVDVSCNWFIPPQRPAVMEVASEVIEKILTTRVREAVQATYSVDTTLGNYLDHTALSFSMEVKPRRVATVRRIIEAAVTDHRAILRETPRAKKKLQVNLRMADWTLADIVEEALDEIAKWGRPITVAEQSKNIARVTPEQVISLFENHVRPDNAFFRLIEA